jgi:hypothetical protein
MCNPRRIRVRATARLAEAWDQEVLRQVTLHGAATGRAAVRESMSARLGAPVLSTLDRVLDGLEGWHQQDDGYRHDLDGGYVHYHAGTGDLEIVAELTADVQAAGEARTTVRGSVEDDLDVEGVGTYYDDGWGGYNEDTARRDAQANADSELEQARAERISRARADLEAAAAGGVHSQAEDAARTALAGVTAARAAELDREAIQRLTTVGVQGRALFQQAVGLACRDTILAYARSRHAEGVRVSGGGGVLDIEFEMEM